MPAVESLAASTAVPLVFVYIAEAHALDDWPLRSRLAMPGNKEAIIERQHQTSAERLKAAHTFVSTFSSFLAKVTMLVDDLDKGDVFSKTMNPWPARLYIVEDGRLVWGSYFEPDGTIDFDKFADQLV